MRGPDPDMSVDRPPEGLQAVLRGERHALLRFLKARLGSEFDAEEVLHDLWARLATTSTGPVLNPRAYVFKMASNLALDRRRAERRRVLRDTSITRDNAIGYGHERVVAADDPDAASILIERDEHARLSSAIAALPNGARRVLTLHKIEELSHSEVAAHLGISRSAVEKHMAVAMRHLRIALVDCGDGSPAASTVNTPRAPK